MQAVFRSLWEWTEQGALSGLATLVSVAGSSPRTPGACLAWNAETGVFHGSVSSGCVENALLDRLPEIVREDQVEVLTFGPESVAPWATGLTCGGTIEVRLERYWGVSPDPVTRAVADAWNRRLSENLPMALLSRGSDHVLVAGDEVVAGAQSVFPPEVIVEAVECLGKMTTSGWSAVASGERVFLRLRPRRPRLFLLGADHVAAELSRLAANLEVQVVVVDPRRAYARPERFPVSPGALIGQWPDAYLRSPETALGPCDAVVALSHDSKIDDPGLLAAFASRCGYIGAIGSRTSQEARRERLFEAGLSEAEWERLRGPVAPSGGRMVRDAGLLALNILQDWIHWTRSAGEVAR